ncbi:MAG: GNAT family N-acetyltransferase [Caulobacter sp.]|nr:GNAT family N-acetyltransferase [Caulobacter sp.]
MTVAVRPAAPEDRPLIEGLMQFYTYDFSQFEAPGSDRFDVDEAGRFAPYPLDPYWREDGHWPLLIEVDGKRAGFALINRDSHRGARNDRHMGEFFIARKFRGAGAGSAALKQIFALHPGQWEIAIAERNAPARAFWPKAIEAAGGRNLVCHQGDGERWTGPILAFTVAG